MASLNHIIECNHSKIMNSKNFSYVIPGTNGSEEKLQVIENGLISQMSQDGYNQSQSKNKENSDAYFHVLLRTRTQFS